MPTIGYRYSTPLEYRRHLIHEVLPLMCIVKIKLLQCFSNSFFLVLGIFKARWQCWVSVTFWFGSGYADPYLWLTDAAPDPPSDPTPFFSDFKDTKIFFAIPIYSCNLPAGNIIFSLKIKFFAKNLCKLIFCKHYFSLLNIFMRKGKDPDPDIWLMDPDPGGPKKCRLPPP